ncbi:hypothetical protein BGX29_001690 [Mortierella sp. GBA35]|nr:hypothetical protein BGX29_001690 [Mortierella sp. GBA35]
MLGIFFWSFQLLPQVVDNYRAKTTKGLSSTMFILWTLSALGFGSYAAIEGLSIPIIVQPHIFGFFSTVCFLQCYYYGQGPGLSKEEGENLGKRDVPLKTILAAAAVLFLVLAGLELAAYYATVAGMDHKVKGTLQAAGIIPVILLTIGFFPQYVDIFRCRSVVGVSMVFITADAAGSVFSIISLVFRDNFDLLAALNYILVLVCDLFIVGLYVYYNKLHPSLARIPQAREASETEPA